MSVLLRASELIGLCVAKLLITVDNFIQPKKRFGVILQSVNLCERRCYTFEDYSSAEAGLALILVDQEVGCLEHLE